MIGLLLVVLLVLSEAHICILNPPQRGPLSIIGPGDDSCYRRKDYCGDVNYDGKITNYLTYDTVDFLFQQNLNHWYQPNPGYFDVSLSLKVPPTDRDWITLAKLDDFPAHEQVTQTNFTVRIQLPGTPVAHGILRLRYVSNNPDESSHNSTIFYNCADIRIVAAPSTIPLKPTKKQQKPQNNMENKAFSCTTSPNFKAQGFESNSVGRVSHTVFYDAVNKMTRWDRTGELEVSGQQQSISLINNYTSMIEYVINPVDSKCELFGPDAFYNWKFGVGMNFVGFWQAGNLKIAEWYNPSNSFRWQAVVNGLYCDPYALFTPHSTLNFFKVERNNVQLKDFTVPLYCNKKQIKKSCSGGNRVSEFLFGRRILR